MCDIFEYLLILSVFIVESIFLIDELSVSILKIGSVLDIILYGRFKLRDLILFDFYLGYFCL